MWRTEIHKIVTTIFPRRGTYERELLAMGRLDNVATYCALIAKPPSTAESPVQQSSLI
jgi:hypothetical protein